MMGVTAVKNTTTLPGKGKEEEEEETSLFPPGGSVSGLNLMCPVKKVGRCAISLNNVVQLTCTHYFHKYVHHSSILFVLVYV